MIQAMQRSLPSSPAKRLLVLSLLSLLLTNSMAQDVTQGPLAPVSLGSYTELATARGCAAACLVYNGIWVCGVNAGYDDLGVALECGCASINGCYCNAGLASSATAYLSRCVSSRCAESVENWTQEVAGMLGIYEGYCATALEAGEGTAAATTTTTTSRARTTTGGATVATDATRSALTSGGAEETSATENGATENGGAGEGKTDGGLSKSDIVALAASLGRDPESHRRVGDAVYPDEEAEEERWRDGDRTAPTKRSSRRAAHGKACGIPL
ncbi:hypothetical protein VD0002_g550 [Verticillium dahliae]|uniref:Extracellular membrane protein CFEM domain-containing protein n=2 Tax=Verticillium dahliae TaxID=27337 RepID=G2XBP8_VERDV|nr:uncharacterized protein VDAG_07684 [Verticillium dahliae VdLs.17]EGY16520.1 hypothetical protein VDAG_07684 [Verticillium dahliae VdLs.17]PNH32742.1 hypothetical protein BJF96_g3944 [Verticillium dahliae]PNH57234.1 hypothetical protein VD0003_g527 [Verticillium dahliae]PNH70039.1 hypothetical protein VD0002_g550 [Verticillium dahliae]